MSRRLGARAYETKRSKFRVERGVGVRGPKPVNDGLLTYCWCRKHADYISKEDVWNGQTWSCGKRGCCEDS